MYSTKTWLFAVDSQEQKSHIWDHLCNGWTCPILYLSSHARLIRILPTCNGTTPLFLRLVNIREVITFRLQGGHSTLKQTTIKRLNSKQGPCSSQIVVVEKGLIFEHRNTFTVSHDRQDRKYRKPMPWANISRWCRSDSLIYQLNKSMKIGNVVGDWYSKLVPLMYFGRDAACL